MAILHQCSFKTHGRSSLRFFSPSSRLKSLDAGCGICAVTTYLARRGLRVQGIDITIFHIEWARQNISDQGLDDMVTAEVADYYHLGNLCLQEFFRVLKPGGSLAMYEYWYVAYSELPSDTPQDLIESNKRVSRYAAMPTRERLTRGVLQSWVKEQGFIDVNEADLSDNIRPMSRLFFVLGYIPYMIIVFLGLQAWFINTEAGVQGYRGLRRKVRGCNALRARKPVGKAIETNT